MLHSSTYKALICRFDLPYRIFVDRAIYKVFFEKRTFEVQLIHHPRQDPKIQRNVSVSLNERAQLKLDNRGFTGWSEVRVYDYFDHPLTEEQITDLLQNPDIFFQDCLKVVNKFIAVYRAKTGEFWFRPVAVADIFSFSIGLWPVDGAKVENYFHGIPRETYSHPYLKSNLWYDDLGALLRDGWEVPFFLELFLEGEDALERGNFRLAAQHFVLCVEALLRALVLEYFPGNDIETKPVEQMMGTYFRRYRGLADPGSLPLDKKSAMRHLEAVWINRDKLMHGHDLYLNELEVRRAHDAARLLNELWFNRPGNHSSLVKEGGFTGQALDNDPNIWVERAKSCLNLGLYEDALEAANFALMLEPDHNEAKSIQQEVSLNT